MKCVIGHMKGSAAHRQHRFHGLLVAQDLHEPVEVIGQYIQARAHIAQATSQEVRIAHPMLERAEHMFHLAPPHHHRIWHSEFRCPSP